MTEPILQGVMVAAIICLVVLTRAIWRHVQSHLTAAEATEMRRVVEEMVLAAELMLAHKPGPQRLEWVLGQLMATYPRIHRYVLRRMVEAIVAQLPHQGRGAADVEH